MIRKEIYSTTRIEPLFTTKPIKDANMQIIVYHEEFDKKMKMVEISHLQVRKS